MFSPSRTFIPPGLVADVRIQAYRDIADSSLRNVYMLNL